MVEEDCCGDSVLATAMQGLGIDLKTSWPSMQGETPSSLDYTSRHFCWAIITQHHMSSHEVQDMWDFEQEWLKRNEIGERRAMTHRDVFDRFVKPIAGGGEREDWDNLSQDITIAETSGDAVDAAEKDAWKSAEECRNACERRRDWCVQWSFGDETCKLGHVIRLGHSVESDEGVKRRSGWMWDRIRDFAASMEPCTPLWIT